MSRVIGFHYTLKDGEGQQIDSSAGKDPLLFLVGSGQIIPGLEKVLVKMNVGDTDTVIVAPEEAYGNVNEDLHLIVKRTQFPADADLKPGVQFEARNESGASVFTVMKIEDDQVFVDGNHPLAGTELHFDVEITEMRAATAEEISHGHAHGAGGHHH